MKWIAIIILIIAGWMIYDLYQKKQTPDLAAEYRYAHKEVDDIAKIRINYRLIDPDILLEKKKNYWLLNAKYRVREDAMEKSPECNQKNRIAIHSYCCCAAKYDH
ncbi:MAG: hypothetical protein IPL46_23335 [Saprospiraceae bacterium]|nr:hypothetical protein [Saprospiraceae bacterium]